MEVDEKIYSHIRETCLEQYKTEITPLELLQKIWEMPEFPMHCPEHHFLIPAVLLTISRRYKNESIECLEEDLNKAEERARNLLPGYCGFFGACGAAVGSGIFFSLLTKTTPYSTQSWGQANRITAKCLHEIAATEGPRCCKRVSFTSLLTSLQFIKDNLGIDLGEITEITCTYHENNKECKKVSCPYFP